MTRTYYFDNNATTRVAPEVRDAMLPFFCDRYGNPSSMHAFGGEVAHDLDHAREEVARFLNADPDEIIFTSCATESDNAAIRGINGCSRRCCDIYAVMMSAAVISVAERR